MWCSVEREIFFLFNGIGYNNNSNNFKCIVPRMMYTHICQTVVAVAVAADVKVNNKRILLRKMLKLLHLFICSCPCP